MTWTSAQMEGAWNTKMTALNESAWVDILSTATGEFYRLPVTNGGLYHWNRTTGLWEIQTPVPGSLVNVHVNYI